ncbi:hypothetical protein [Saccharothrix syringae]|uniref:Uncharacterized protein n=1 Tax=Saccharothrix syringae TaxID=103733 RepID=A0A5Q0H1Q8_SACSY|nr:hypothetical protein [Saccharothrix syringae]QFZ20196.1 hypothetical protein EKG83_24780 [Saccharothrix syringae]
MPTEDDQQGTRQVRMPVPPGGDADRHPGSPDLGRPDPDPEPATGDEGGGHPHSGHRHEVADDEGLPGEFGQRRVVHPPGGR